MSKTRRNHYVPQWYQRGFFSPKINKLHYLDLQPDQKKLSDGRVFTMNNYYLWPTSQCFYRDDLYTTFFGKYINDEIERKLFSEIDDTGSQAVRAFISDDVSKWHVNFSNFFSYIDAQKIRTPKGLDWIKSHYSQLNQLELMLEMQAIRNLHCTIWSEGVREIVSAKNSNIKFIISDNPVTIYNYACSPKHTYCSYPNEPSISLKGTQTIFPLDIDHCLILTNYEYAKDSSISDPLEKRTFSRNFRNSLVKTDSFIRSRFLNEAEIEKINLIVKSRAHRYIAAAEKDWLYPERNIKLKWSELKDVLIPPEDDPRVISQFAVSSTLYFDEVIIQNPLINPASVKPEFSPVENPQKYKQDTIKNVLLFLSLFPFIESGYINFIPDLCAFDTHIRDQMFSMAQARTKDKNIGMEQERFMEILQKDDLERMIRMLPKRYQKAQIKKAMPDLSEEKIEMLLEHFDQKNLNDPLTLLQDDVYAGNDGQMQMMNMSPNFEISLFLSQATGAFLLTDSPYRWNEIINSQNTEGGAAVYDWKKITDLIQNLELILNLHPPIVFHLRSTGKLIAMRKSFEELFSAVGDETALPKVKLITEKLIEQFTKGYVASQKEMEKFKTLGELNEKDIKASTFTAKVTCLIPKGGIVHNNAFRLLLSAASDNHTKNVPMAIYLERT